MKIAIIGSRGYPSTYGGFETLVRVLAPYLAARGHRVVVYGRQNGHLHKPRQTAGGVTAIDVAGFNTKSLSTLSSGLFASLDAALRGFDAALVLNVANGYFLPILRARRIPTVMNVDGLEWERDKWGPAAKRIFRYGAATTARWATSLVADSRAIAEVWANELGRDATFIPYGGKLRTAETSGPAFRNLGLGREPYVLVVARLAPENNVDLALDALDMLDDRPPLIVVGSANYDSATKRRLQRLERSGHVRWLGHVADQELLDDLWANSAAYIHGHSVGGTNPALVQALAAGAPTLALRTVFNREVIGNEEQLYEHDRQELAAKAQDLLNNPAKQKRFSREGQARVAASYSWEHVCHAYLDELTRVVGRA